MRTECKPSHLGRTGRAICGDCPRRDNATPARHAPGPRRQPDGGMRAMSITMEREEVAVPAAYRQPERSPLDEAYSFIRDYLDITEAQAVAITLIAAHTHALALGAFVTTCRLLF